MVVLYIKFEMEYFERLMSEMLLFNKFLFCCCMGCSLHVLPVSKWGSSRSLGFLPQPKNIHFRPHDHYKCS